MQEIHLSTLLVKGERKGERSGYRQNPVISIVQAADRHNPYGKREKGTSTVQSHTAGGKAQSGDKQKTPPGGQARPDGTRKSYGRRQGPVRGQAETPTRRAETLTC